MERHLPNSTVKALAKSNFSRTAEKLSVYSSGSNGTMHEPEPKMNTFFAMFSQLIKAEAGTELNHFIQIEESRICYFFWLENPKEIQDIKTRRE